MQCEDIEIELPRPCLNELDNALNELGMLSTRTKSRDEYLNEIRNKQYLNMLTINTRYVSNVSIGFRVRPVGPHVRYKPYKLPRERHRTKSENSDNESVNIVKNLVQDDLDVCLEIKQLKKAKSLESIIGENNQNLNLKSISFQDQQEIGEVEVVSKSIQNLRVNE